MFGRIQILGRKAKNSLDKKRRTRWIKSGKRNSYLQQWENQPLQCTYRETKCIVRCDTQTRFRRSRRKARFALSTLPIASVASRELDRSRWVGVSSRFYLFQILSHYFLLNFVSGMKKEVCSIFEFMISRLLNVLRCQSSCPQDVNAVLCWFVSYRYFRNFRWHGLKKFFQMLCRFHWLIKKIFCISCVT